MYDLKAGKKLFHGSLELVKEPDADYQKKKQELQKDSNKKRTLDFGFGFYLTDDFDRAVEWTRSKIRNFNKHKGKDEEEKTYGYVSGFKLKIPILPSPKIKIFNSYDKEWLSMIGKGRMNEQIPDYDIIIGSVADANTEILLTAYYNNRPYYTKEGEKIDFGKMSKSEKDKVALKLLRFNPPFIQLCFRKNHAIKKYLRFDKEKIVTKEGMVR